MNGDIDPDIFDPNPRCSAVLCARFVIDAYFIERGYGSMVDASELAGRIVAMFDLEDRLAL